MNKKEPSASTGDLSQHKLLIANRGEIALRIIRTCRVLRIPNIIVFSEADRDSLPVKLADEAICIGPAPASESYLRMERILTAAVITGATAIHPGYGFLSENHHFAQICQDMGIAFIGPSPKAIAELGDKAAARKTMLGVGVPVIPGSEGTVGDIHEALQWADKIGYPVILKASAGGGGKGMRVAADANQLAKAFQTATAEAKADFGNPDLYIEKYLNTPRHVEVQIIADSTGKVLCLGERDCSWQRRHQKLIEESPCPVLGEETRQKMYAAAEKAARSVHYTGVGTVEFLLDPVTGDFFFMEMNTRLQVEHPVTEEICGLDIVAAQIRVGLGENLPWKQSDIVLRGHALEIRINAEDPARDFAPFPGRVEFFQAPGGPGVRMDSHLYDGYRIPPYYDSLIAKLIISGDSREVVRRRALTALQELSIEGVRTTADFARRIIETPQFISGDYNTGTLEKL